MYIYTIGSNIIIASILLLLDLPINDGTYSFWSSSMTFGRLVRYNYRLPEIIYELNVIRRINFTVKDFSNSSYLGCMKVGWNQDICLLRQELDYDGRIFHVL